MSKPAESGSNPPGVQPSGVANYSSTNTNAGGGPGTQAPSAYFKTLPGILKIVSVVCGLFAMSLTAYADNNGLWFSPLVFTECSYTSCQTKYYYYEDSCKSNLGPTRESKKSCPTRWMVTPQLYIIAFSWAGTFIVLIVLLFVDLTKKPMFSTIDMIGHFVAGILAIVSGLCLIGFSISVWIYNLCGETNGPHRRNLQENSTITASERQFKVYKTCEDIESAYFKQWHVFFGGLFAVATGILYLVIGIASRKGQQVRPMMGRFGTPAQTESRPYQMPQAPPRA